ncbi:unnamed protein product [Urochloa humidicola]
MVRTRDTSLGGCGPVPPLSTDVQHQAPVPGGCSLVPLSALGGSVPDGRGLVPPSGPSDASTPGGCGLVPPSGPLDDSAPPILYNKHQRHWWERHNYLLSGALDAGLAFMAVLLYLCLGLENKTLNWWGNDLDGCPLASCPTAKGITVHGCPVHI